jgi:hypothetical protein
MFPADALPTCSPPTVEWSVIALALLLLQQAAAAT